MRTLTNIAGYQLDRNKLEAELLKLNGEKSTFDFCAPATKLNVSLSESGPHTVSFKTRGHECSVKADWVVDTSGRGKFLSRRKSLAKPSPIRHGASFFWVEGLVNIEKLTDLSPREIRLRKDRAATGHLPLWLATNHFTGEGFWFWVIPLQGKTSLGLVYDSAVLPHERVSTAQKLIEWVCQEFPLFARDLPYRTILDYGSFKDFSYDCVQTIDQSKWALSGEAGRFTDPLYSPGGDFIAIHNTLITDAILTMDQSKLASKCWLYEQLMQSFNDALVPIYTKSYDTLGDQETFALKYTWDLVIYFAFFVFPFINDLFTDRQFDLIFLSKFSRLGPINRNLQSFLSDYYQWKKSERRVAPHVLFYDFSELGPLRAAESTFYAVGVSTDEARQILNVQLSNLKELARFIVAHINSVVLSDQRVLTNSSFIESIDLHHIHFDPQDMCERYAQCASSSKEYKWSFDPTVFSRFHLDPPANRMEDAAAAGG